MILYHVTTKRALKGILKNGIRFGSSPIHGYKKDRVYLTDKAGIKVVAKFWVCIRPKEIYKGFPIFPTEVMVVKVDIPKSWIEQGPTEEYRMNPVANEYWSYRKIPASLIRDVYEIVCKYGGD